MRVAAVGVSVLAGGTLLAESGLAWLLVGAGVLGVTALAAAGSPTGTADEPPSRAERGWRRAFALLILAMLVVVVLADSVGTPTLLLLAMLATGAFALLPQPRMSSLITAPVIAGLAAVPGVRWLLLPRRSWRWTGASVPVVRGLAAAAVLFLLVGGLLVSADAAFAGLADYLLPTWSPDTMVARLAIVAAIFVVVAGSAYSAATVVRQRPRKPRPGRAAVEWLLPLMVLVVLLGIFFAVQSAVLFGHYPPALVEGSLTRADLARRGFGQLVVVTLLVALSLTWAAARLRPADRALFMGCAGGLVLEMLLLVASALRRMYFYQQAFGLTALRVDVAAFEVWLAVVIVLAAVLWVARRAAAIPRMLVLTAGASLSVLLLVGPDAIVARANVLRFENVGRVDAGYLARLGPDAVPALDRLPEPFRSCALSGQATALGVSADSGSPRTPDLPADQPPPEGSVDQPAPTERAEPWYAWNLSRERARRILAERPVEAEFFSPECVQ
ncbi:MAG: DUF4173 domain-containing protein [Actinomycetales bacterium]